jgi:hypothetical protein
MRTPRATRRARRNSLKENGSGAGEARERVF